MSQLATIAKCLNMEHGDLCHTKLFCRLAVDDSEARQPGEPLKPDPWESRLIVKSSSDDASESPRLSLVHRDTVRSPVSEAAGERR